MTTNSSSGHGPVGARAMLAVVLLTLVGLGTWGILRARHQRDVDDRLASWAGAPLPNADEPVDTILAGLGADVFQTHCAGCHALQGEARIGPTLEGVTKRRPYAWIRSMILHPDSMTLNDPVARDLRETYGVQMMVPGKPLTPVHARALIEFLRRLDALGSG